MGFFSNRISKRANGIVQIYITDIEELLQITESRAAPQLTAKEKAKYEILDLN